MSKTYRKPTSRAGHSGSHLRPVFGGYSHKAVPLSKTALGAEPTADYAVVRENGYGKRVVWTGSVQDCLSRNNGQFFRTAEEETGKVTYTIKAIGRLHQ